MGSDWTPLALQAQEKLNVNSVLPRLKFHAEKMTGREVSQHHLTTSGAAIDGVKTNNSVPILISARADPVLLQVGARGSGLLTTLETTTSGGCSSDGLCAELSSPKQ